jgi:hypothetical protein
MSCRVAALAGAALAALLVAAAPVVAAPDVQFGVYFDAAGTVCHGTITPGAPGTVYIVANTPPGTEVIAGAEFRFTGLPESWTVYPVPNASLLTIGNPFENGVVVAATDAQCQPEWSTFLMYTVLVIATDEAEDVTFELTNREPPSNPAFHCAFVMDCSVSYEKYCVQTSPCFVNATAPAPCAATTAVENTTWSKLREMYR